MLFGVALGAEVTVFSHQQDKLDDAKKMGAKEAVLTTEEDFAKPYALTFDFIISTIDLAKAIPLTDLTSMLWINGRLHICAMPDDELPSFKSQDIAANGASASFFLPLPLPPSLSRGVAILPPVSDRKLTIFPSLAIGVNHIGSKKEAEAMLKLAAEKGIKTWKQGALYSPFSVPFVADPPLLDAVIPMKDVAKAVKGVHENDARYRYVLKADL